MTRRTGNFIGGLIWTGLLLVASVAAGQALPPAIVVTGQVFETRFSDTQSFVGSFEARRQTIIGSAVDGRVRSVEFEQGDHVKSISDGGEAATSKQSQILVEIETGTLQIEIETAAIQLQLAEQALEELNIVLPIEIELATAREAETRARAQYSENEFARLKRIADQANNAISSTELEQSRSQFLSDQQLNTQAAGELRRLQSTRELRVRQATSRVAAARQEVIRLEDQKSKHMIRAPFDGYIVRKLTEAGAWISRGDPVAELAQLDEVDFAFNIPQQLVGKVQVALANPENSTPVSIVIDELGQPLVGKLLAVVPQVDLRSRLVTVRARVNNPIVGEQPLIKPGMIGRAELALGRIRDMKVLSRDALVLGGPQPVVFKVVERDKKTFVVSVPVTLGVSQGRWIEVYGDVTTGDRVVVEGNEQLKAETEVSVSKTRDERPNDG